MTTTTTSGTSAGTMTSRVIAGIIGGLAGGIIFGMLMWMMGMLDDVAMLINSESIFVGWLVHLFNSALFGAIFGAVFGPWIKSWGTAIGLGMVYGVIWWVLGALLIMPAWLGRSDMIFKIDGDQGLSLMGHLIYGLLLGAVYQAVRRRLDRA